MLKESLMNARFLSIRSLSLSKADYLPATGKTGFDRLSLRKYFGSLRHSATAKKLNNICIKINVNSIKTIKI